MPTIMKFIRYIPYPFRVVFAILMLIVGIIGLVLPILQGWFFLGIAAYTLYPEKSREVHEKIREKIKKWFKK